LGGGYSFTNLQGRDNKNCVITWIERSRDVNWHVTGCVMRSRQNSILLNWHFCCGPSSYRFFVGTIRLNSQEWVDLKHTGQS